MKRAWALLALALGACSGADRNPVVPDPRAPVVAPSIAPPTATPELTPVAHVNGRASLLRGR